MNFRLTLAAQMNEKNVDQRSAAGGVEMFYCVSSRQSFYLFPFNISKVDMVFWYLGGCVGA